MVEQLIGHAVVARIDHDKDIVAAHRVLHQALGVAALEAGALARDDKALLLDACLSGPAHQMTVDQIGQLFRTGAGQQTQLRNAGLLEKSFRGDFIGHSFATPSLFFSQKHGGVYLSLFYHKTAIPTPSICPFGIFSAPCTGVVKIPHPVCELSTKRLPFLCRFFPVKRVFLHENTQKGNIPLLSFL